MNLHKLAGYMTIVSAPLLFLWHLKRYGTVQLLPLAIYFFLLVQGIKLLRKNTQR